MVKKSKKRFSREKRTIDGKVAAKEVLTSSVGNKTFNMVYGSRDGIDFGKKKFSVGDGSPSSVVTDIDFGPWDNDGSLNQ
jgi:hypothetical protein